jgi:DNA-binding transcriptional regulator YiaG
MLLIGRALRSEIADAVGLKDLQREVRTELRALTREITSLRRMLGALRQGGERAGSAKAPARAPAISPAQIQGLRDRLGDTRKAFAARMRVSPSIIFMWETGRSAPKRTAIVERLQQLLRESGARSKVGERPASEAKGSRRRPIKLTAKRRAALELQGRYMGALRALEPKQKAQVKAVKASKGYPAAIALAKSLAA